MYGFLLRPRWIISHVAVLAALVAMVNLSIWQFDRLDEKRDLNATIASRADRTPSPFAEVLDEVGVTSAPDGLPAEFRSASVRGTYLADEEFTIPSKTFNGAPGRYVVTPLRWSESEPDLLVLRGFIPQAVDDTNPPIDGIEPPSGEVVLRGWLRMSQVPEGIQAKTADLGDNKFARIDIDRIEVATGNELQPVYFQLGAQRPETESAMLTMIPLPERSEGPHFSYGMQWAIFTLIGAVGYVLIIRRVARTQGELAADTDGD